MSCWWFHSFIRIVNRVFGWNGLMTDMQANELNVNLSQTLEQSLSEVVREAKQQRWLAENHDAIKAYNRRIEANGVFSDGLRRF